VRWKWLGDKKVPNIVCMIWQSYSLINIRFDELNKKKCFFINTKMFFKEFFLYENGLRIKPWGSIRHYKYQSLYLRNKLQKSGFPHFEKTNFCFVGMVIHR